MEAPVNHQVEKAAYAAQWLATKFFVQQLQNRYKEKGANYLDPLVQIEREASRLLKKLENDTYVLPSDLLDSGEVITLMTVEESLSQLDHVELRHRLIESHLSSIKSLIPAGFWENRTGFEEFENKVLTGWEPQSGQDKHPKIDWFELVCAFFNELLKGDNNKAKDGYQNQLLAKISLQNRETKETLNQALEQFDQRFVADRIGTEFFEEVKETLKEEFKAVQDSLRRMESKIDETLANTKKILEALSKSTDAPNTVKFITPVPSVQNAMRLVGRIDDIKTVITMLDRPHAQVLIYAMKGTGKTTLARAVTKTLLAGGQINCIVWLNNGNNLLSALIEQVGRTRLREQVEKAYEAKLPPEAIVQQLIVPYLLNQNGGYNLLVIDNLTHDQRTDYRKVCDGLGNWRILTTAYEQVGEKFDVYPLQLLPADEARMLFYRYYEQAELDDTSIDALVGAVGYHTLTIEIMAKTADTLGLTPKRLLQKFKENELALSKESLDIDIDHSLDAVDGLLPYYKVIFDFSGLNAFEQNLLLQLCILPAVSLNKPFIRAVLRIKEDTEEDEKLSLALKSVVKRGWLQETNRNYFMHQVVQAMVRNKLNPNVEKCKKLILNFSSIISKYFDSNPISVTYLIPFSESILDTFQGENNEILNELYLSLGLLYLNLGNYQKAEFLFLKLLNNYKGIYGEKHPDLAGCYNNIGLVYKRQGEYNRAIENFKKSLMIRRDIYGESHLDVADSYNNIGMIYDKQGEYITAIDYYKRALKIRLNLLDIHDEKYFKVAGSYNNLGLVYVNLERYSLAIDYHNKALEIRRSILGDKDPRVAESYNNLGVVYISQKDYMKSFEYYEKSLQIISRVYGDEHQNTAGCYYNLGTVYAMQGDYINAMKYFQKALTIQINVLGSYHFEVGDSYNNIGMVYNQQRIYDKALYYYFLDLIIVIKRLPDQNLSTTKTVQNVNSIFHNPLASEFFKAKIQQKDEATIELMQQGKVIFTKLFNKEILARIDEILNQPE